MKSLLRSPQSRPAGRRIAGRAQEDHTPDPYQLRQKPAEPSLCPQCGAVYHRGRWQWGPRPDDAQAEPCPACRRIEDQLPAGILTLNGGAALAHKAELTSLARRQGEAETSEHPLNRIIAIAEAPDGLVITTTDIHLPRRIGEAVKRAFHGELSAHFDEAQYFVRVDWHPPR